jgi:hypothetical protein
MSPPALGAFSLRASESLERLARQPISVKPSVLIRERRRGRRPDKSRSLLPCDRYNRAILKLERLDGDALDQHTIERALIGVDVVIQTVGVSPTPEMIFSGTRLFSVATRILVDAMEEKGLSA